MKKQLLLLAIFAMTTFAFSSSAFAQGERAPNNALSAGEHSLSFSVPGGGNPYAGGAFGYWMMLSPNINLGLNVGLGIDPREGFDPDSGEETTNYFWNILLAPTLKYYPSTRGDVAMFYFGQLNFGIGGGAGETDDPGFGIAGGLGVEWFPVTRFSISGQAGLGIDIVRPGLEPFGVGTFTSALAANIYF